MDFFNRNYNFAIFPEIGISRVLQKKSVAIKFCRHLAYFLVAASLLMLRPRLLCWGCFAFATQICYVATTLFCMQHIFLSWPSFSGHDITFLPLACLRVTTLISYRYRTVMCLAYLCVAT